MLQRLSLRVLLASATAVVILAPDFALAGPDETSDVDELIAAARKTQNAIITAYNDRRWEDLPPLYVEDAVMLPPNHAPIHGRDAIIEFLRSARDAVGVGDLSNNKNARVVASGNLVNFVYEFTARDGHVRMVTNELYERQSDGSVRITVDEPSFTDPQSSPNMP